MKMKGHLLNFIICLNNFRIRQLIVRVGDEGAKYYKRDINKLTTNIIGFYNSGDGSAKEFLIKIFVEWYYLNHLKRLITNSVSLLTNKSSIYATTLSLISLQNPSLAEIIIDRVIDQLQIALDQGEYN